MISEKHRRINISVCAWAYEKYNVSLISDQEYDERALQIDLSKTTDNQAMDRFFKQQYLSYTGQWIYKHPELLKLDALVRYIIEVKSAHLTT